MTTHPTTDWERRSPEEVGLDADRVQAAVDYHKTHETPHTQLAYDFSTYERMLRTAEGDHAAVVGPMPDRRGGPSGMVLHEGRVVAEYGDTKRADQTFSVAKTFLALLAGVAVDRGLVADVTDPVAEYVDDGGFDDPHNGQVTWEHLLTNTSEWRGELFGKPDAVDRNRGVADVEGERGERELQDPGTHWEYNDVRINRLALSLLRLFERPLPAVLEETIMDPIGASDAWSWHGYETSMVEVGGREVESVSGGGHWGGGIWIPTRDLARVGLLLANRGRWDGEQLLPASWVDRMTTPCELQPTYGYLTWLNTDRALWPDAPETSFAALGFGSNVVWVAPDRDLVAVLRWLRMGDRSSADRPHQNAVLGRLSEAVD